MRRPAKNECGKKKQQKNCSARNFDWNNSRPQILGILGIFKLIDVRVRRASVVLRSGPWLNSFQFSLSCSVGQTNSNHYREEQCPPFLWSSFKWCPYQSKVAGLGRARRRVPWPILAESTLYWLDLVVHSDCLEKSLGPRWRVSWAQFGATLGPAISTNWSSSCPSTLTHCTDTTPTLSWTPPWKP